MSFSAEIWFVVFVPDGEEGSLLAQSWRLLPAVPHGQPRLTVLRRSAGPTGGSLLGTSSLIVNVSMGRPAWSERGKWITCCVFTLFHHCWPQ
jgi:hypothetical protein